MSKEEVKPSNIPGDSDNAGEDPDQIKAELEEKPALEDQYEPETKDSDSLIQSLKSLDLNGEMRNEFRLDAMKPCTSINILDQLTLDSASIQACLTKFTSKETLADKLNCEKCSKKQKTKVYTRSLKQYLICDLPAVLTIHLKRFVTYFSLNIMIS